MSTKGKQEALFYGHQSARTTVLLVIALLIQIVPGVFDNVVAFDGGHNLPVPVPAPHHEHVSANVTESVSEPFVMHRGFQRKFICGQVYGDTAAWHLVGARYQGRVLVVAAYHVQLLTPSLHHS